MNKISDILPEDDRPLEKESPLLHSISKENPFSVPGDYFDTLPSQIIEKCREKVEPKNWGKGFFTILSGYKWRLLTATSCLAIICFFALHTNTRPLSYEAMAQNIPDSVIVAHLDNNIADISVSSLEDIQSENIESSVKTPSDTANTDQDIIAYLMNNKVSISDIENE